MFDMGKWSDYLDQYMTNARKAGATPVELLQLIHIQEGMLLVQCRALEVLQAVDGG